MKTIGMVGGTGWISTLEYYRHINEETNRRLGGLEAARCLLYSLNYGDVDRMNRAGDPRGVYALVLQGAQVLAGGHGPARLRYPDHPRQGRRGFRP